METIKRTEAENQQRQSLIERLESFTGSLQSMPYNQISTGDLQKIYNALVYNYQKAR